MTNIRQHEAEASIGAPETATKVGAYCAEAAIKVGPYISFRTG